MPDRAPRCPLPKPADLPRTQLLKTLDVNPMRGTTTYRHEVTFLGTQQKLVHQVDIGNDQLRMGMPPMEYVDRQLQEGIMRALRDHIYGSGT